MIKEILLLGNYDLYRKSSPVEEKDIDLIKQTVSNLHDTLIDFRKNTMQAGQLPHLKLVYSKGLYICTLTNL